MVKVSPEIKKLADKYCDEHGGPPKPKETPIVEIDYGREALNLIWIDKCGRISIDKWDKLAYAYGVQEKPALMPQGSPTLKASKTRPTVEKPWSKFNPTSKNPKRRHK